MLKIFMSRGVPAAVEIMQSSGLIRPSSADASVIDCSGCLMDSLSMILLAMPFLWPVIDGLDFGLGPEELKIWFGI